MSVPEDEERSPLLCDIADKPLREAENAIAQLEYIVHLVNERAVKELRESHLLELHSLAIQGIYNCGGKYRDARVKITIGHRAPEPALVPVLTRQLLDGLNAMRATHTAHERAALALWRLNWIHPFAGGNGRTSRALAYLVLCTHRGAMLPGSPMPAIILKDRDRYVAALREVDATLGDNDDREPELTSMTAYVRDVVVSQYESFLHEIARTIAETVVTQLFENKDDGQG